MYKNVMLNFIVFLLFLLIFVVFIIPVFFLYVHLHVPRMELFDNPKNHGLNYEDIFVTTLDNVRLNGWYIPCKNPKGTVIVCHGVGANRADILPVALTFHSGSYEVYMFDFRGHGTSGDALVTYGFNERKDIKAIVKYLKSHGKNKLGIYGLSMGGAIVILSGPGNKELKAFVIDSAFASAEKVLKYRLNKIAPAFVVTYMAKIANAYSTWFYKVSINEVTPIDVVNKINRPMLFIIGDKDTNITPDNGEMLFKKASEPKELLIIKGANHTDTINSPEFKEKVIVFMDKYLH